MSCKCALINSLTMVLKLNRNKSILKTGELNLVGPLCPPLPLNVSIIHNQILNSLNHSFAGWNSVLGAISQVYRVFPLFDARKNSVLTNHNLYREADL